MHKVQEFWGENTGLAIDLNRDPITDLKEYAVIMACSIFEFLSYITVVLVYKTRLPKHYVCSDYRMHTKSF